MNEIESRILDIDSEEIIQKLEAFDAKKIFDGEQISHIFRKEDFRGFFRIREEGDKIIVTLKAKRKNSEHAKVRDEQERKAESVEQAKKYVEALGFSFDRIFEKHRAEYVVDNVHFCLDTHPGIPTYLEIEAVDEPTIIFWAEKMGFSKEQLNNWSGKKLFKHYGIPR